MPVPSWDRDGKRRGQYLVQHPEMAAEIEKQIRNLALSGNVVPDKKENAE